MSSTMKEKSFDRCYDLTSPKATFTRAANRFLKEYEEVNRFLTDEARAFAAAVKAVEEYINDTSEEYDSGKQYSSGEGFRDYNYYRTTSEFQYQALFDTDEYGEPVYSVRWYLFEVTKYTKYLRGSGLEKSSTDLEELARWTREKRGKYRYFCTHRPPSPGGIPRGYTTYEEYSSRSRYCGEVTYDEKPDEREAYNWGLVLDPDWERERQAWLGEEGSV